MFNPKDFQESKQNKNFTSLEDVVKFGKHKGKTIDDILWNDPQWLEWAVKNANVVLSADLEKQLMEELKK